MDECDANPGLTKARAAALAVGGFLAVPDFGANRPDGATDFNDLHQLAGPDAVKACIDRAAMVAGTVDAWPEPTPLPDALPPVDPFDAELLPVALRAWVTVWPDVTGDFVHVDQWPDTPAKQTAWAVFERLAQLQPASDTDPVIWRFSPEAQDLFVEWLVPFEKEIRGDDLHPAMVSHLSKYRKLIPALALVFALIDTPDSGGVIHEAELIRALAMGEYLRPHANRLYAAAVIPETTDAVTLLVKIKGGNPLA